jgi:hypothetical protein
MRSSEFEFCAPLVFDFARFPYRLERNKFETQSIYVSFSQTRRSGPDFARTNIRSLSARTLYLCVTARILRLWSVTLMFTTFVSSRFIRSQNISLAATFAILNFRAPVEHHTCPLLPQFASHPPEEKMFWMYVVVVTSITLLSVLLLNTPTVITPLFK